MTRRRKGAKAALDAHGGGWALGAGGQEGWRGDPGRPGRRQAGLSRWERPVGEVQGWVGEKWGPPSPGSRTKLRAQLRGRQGVLGAVPGCPREQEAATSVRDMEVGGW